MTAQMHTEYRVIAAAGDERVVLTNGDNNEGWVFVLDLLPGAKPDVLRRYWSVDDARQFVSRFLAACPEARPYVKVQTRQRSDWTDV